MNFNFIKLVPSFRPMYAGGMNASFRFVMRVSFLYFTLFLSLGQLLMAHSGKGQGLNELKITLKAQQESLISVIKKVQKESKISFVIPLDEVEMYNNINFAESHRSVKETLDLAFQNTSLSYKQVNDKTVLIFVADELGIEQVFLVTGKVMDENGVALSGVSVSVKGTQQSTMTNSSGDFQISLPKNTGITLVFSYIGYENQELPINNQSTVDVFLKEDIKDLEEVVVTALGISREKRSLGYSTQKLDGAELTESPASNFVNNISGKIAGVQISGSGSVGGSSRITIRGESSLNMQGNQPLFVIDGVPIGNDAVVGSSGLADYGNSSAEVNPADIESMNVLKGPAAAALYGSRAANGAIVITTKKGSAGQGMDISFNSYYFVEEVAWLPKFQNQFGQGRDGVYKGSNFGASWSVYPDGDQDGSDESWGPRLDNGTMEKQFNSPTTNGFRGGDVAINNRGDVIATPWISHPNNIKDFFDTGGKAYNNLAFSGGNDKGVYRLSLSALNEKGTIPNNDLDRYQVSLNSSYKLTSKLSSSINFNYMKQTSTNRPENGYSRNTFMYFFTWMTRQVDINDLRNYWQPGLEGIRQFQYNYGENHNNPFFMMYENTKAQDKDRVYGNIALEYAFTDRLKLKVRTAEDLYYDFRPMKTAVSTVDAPLGGYEETRLKYEERNTDLLLSYNGTADTDLGYVLSLGANRFDQNNASLGATNTGLLVPGVYNLGNTSQLLRANNWSNRKRINSVYAMANMNYRSLLYLDLTARNDWSSTLPASNNSYFYPSLGLNANMKDILRLPNGISQAQLRFSWAQVGNDAGSYSLVSTYEYGAPWGSDYSLIGSNTLMNSNLKPEITSTYEAGTALGFFNNRLGIDVTYYDIRSRNQILWLPVVESSGQSGRMINAGEIKNTGFEIMLSGTPITTDGGFRWNFNVNWSHNIGKVISLTENETKIVQAAPGEDGSIQARVGEKMGAIWGPGYQRVPDGPLKGQIIIGSNGKAMVTTEEMYLGNLNPDWTAGFYNQIIYRNFNLNFLFAGQFGGKFISRFYNKAAGSGQLLESAWGRGERAPGTEYDAPYYAQGAALMPDGSYQPNSTGDPGRLDAGVYGTDVRSMVKGLMDHISEAQLFSATYFKLRELSVGYSLPNKLIENVFIKNARISLTGRNLLIFRPKSNHHFDPEVSVATTGSGLIPGFENMSVPSTREIGLSLNLNF